LVKVHVKGKRNRPDKKEPMHRSGGRKEPMKAQRKGGWAEDLE
jgi:hypothetical protein